MKLTAEQREALEIAQKFFQPLVGERFKFVARQLKEILEADETPVQED